MKSHNKAVGYIGENKANLYLKKHGYKIHKRNFRTKTGEIDIIAEKEGVLVFAEVKTRMQSAYGTPAEAVNFRKQKNITETAKIYLMRLGVDTACRFDVIEVMLKKRLIGYSAKINHIENAF